MHELKLVRVQSRVNPEYPQRILICHYEVIKELFKTFEGTPVVDIIAEPTFVLSMN